MKYALIVDDEPDALELLCDVVKSEGFVLSTADSLQSARAQLVRQQPEVLLTDLMLPDGQGTGLVADLDVPSRTQVVVMTGHASLASAIDAVRLGVADYLTKPLDIERLLDILRRPRYPESLAGALRSGPMAGFVPGSAESAILAGFRPAAQLLGSSMAMARLRQQLERVASTTVSVLLYGESGTGKELAARAIHDLSPRSHGPYLAVNCGAISSKLVESELFGHERGSFTGADRLHKGFFERAHGGTLFLDEVTELPYDLQVKLLRVLETGTVVRVGSTKPLCVDMRIVAACNRRPEELMASGSFREDLYHRLSVFPVELPPLRKRGSDIEFLAQHFLDELNETEGTSKRFDPRAIDALYANNWPGNVRELRNFVQRSFILADEVLDLAGPVQALREDDGHETGIISFRVGTPLEEVERRVTMATLQKCNHIKRRAAEMLGISLKTLYNRLDSYAAKDGARIQPEDPAK